MVRILIVEDEANIRKFAAVNLRARGYEVVEAETVEQGIARFREAIPGLMLLDIKLPDRSGWEMLQLIGDDPGLPKIPVVVITASLGETTPSDMKYPNLHRILIKPVGVQELIKVVEEALIKA